MLGGNLKVLKVYFSLWMKGYLVASLVLPWQSLYAQGSPTGSNPSTMAASQNQALQTDNAQLPQQSMTRDALTHQVLTSLWRLKSIYQSEMPAFLESKPLLTRNIFNEVLHCESISAPQDEQARLQADGEIKALFQAIQAFLSVKSGEADFYKKYRVEAEPQTEKQINLKLEGKSCRVFLKSDRTNLANLYNIHEDPEKFEKLQSELAQREIVQSGSLLSPLFLLDNDASISQIELDRWIKFVTWMTDFRNAHNQSLVIQGFPSTPGPTLKVAPPLSGFVEVALQRLEELLINNFNRAQSNALQSGQAGEVTDEDIYTLNVEKRKLPSLRPCADDVTEQCLLSGSPSLFEKVENAIILSLQESSPNSHGPYLHAMQTMMKKMAVQELNAINQMVPSHLQVRKQDILEACKVDPKSYQSVVETGETEIDPIYPYAHQLDLLLDLRESEWYIQNIQKGLAQVLEDLAQQTQTFVLHDSSLELTSITGEYQQILSDWLPTFFAQLKKSSRVDKNGKRTEDGASYSALQKQAMIGLEARFKTDLENNSFDSFLKDNQVEFLVELLAQEIMGYVALHYQEIATSIRTQSFSERKKTFSNLFQSAFHRLFLQLTKVYLISMAQRTTPTGEPAYSLPWFREDVEPSLENRIPLVVLGIDTGYLNEVLPAVETLLGTPEAQTWVTSTAQRFFELLESTTFFKQLEDPKSQFEPNLESRLALEKQVTEMEDWSEKAFKAKHAFDFLSDVYAQKKGLLNNTLPRFMRDHYYDYAAGELPASAAACFFHPGKNNFGAGLDLLPQLDPTSAEDFEHISKALSSMASRLITEETLAKKLRQKWTDEQVRQQFKVPNIEALARKTVGHFNQLLQMKFEDDSQSMRLEARQDLAPLKSFLAKPWMSKKTYQEFTTQRTQAIFEDRLKPLFLELSKIQASSSNGQIDKETWDKYLEALVVELQNSDLILSSIDKSSLKAAILQSGLMDNLSLAQVGKQWNQANELIQAFQSSKEPSQMAWGKLLDQSPEKALAVISALRAVVENAFTLQLHDKNWIQRFEMEDFELDFLEPASESLSEEDLEFAMEFIEFGWFGVVIGAEFGRTATLEDWTTFNMESTLKNPQVKTIQQARLSELAEQAKAFQAPMRAFALAMLEKYKSMKGKLAQEEIHKRLSALGQVYGRKLYVQTSWQNHLLSHLRVLESVLKESPLEDKEAEKARLESSFSFFTVVEQELREMFNTFRVEEVDKESKQAIGQLQRALFPPFEETAQTLDALIDDITQMDANPNNTLDAVRKRQKEIESAKRLLFISETDKAFYDRADDWVRTQLGGGPQYEKARDFLEHEDYQLTSAEKKARRQIQNKLLLKTALENYFGATPSKSATASPMAQLISSQASPEPRLEDSKSPLTQAMDYLLSTGDPAKKVVEEHYQYHYRRPRVIEPHLTLSISQIVDDLNKVSQLAGDVAPLSLDLARQTMEQLDAFCAHTQKTDLNQSIWKHRYETALSLAEKNKASSQKMEKWILDFKSRYQPEKPQAEAEGAAIPFPSSAQFCQSVRSFTQSWMKKWPEPEAENSESLEIKAENPDESRNPWSKADTLELWLFLEPMVGVLYDANQGALRTWMDLDSSKNNDAQTSSTTLTYLQPIGEIVPLPEPSTTVAQEEGGAESLTEGEKEKASTTQKSEEQEEAKETGRIYSEHDPRNKKSQVQQDDIAYHHALTGIFAALKYYPKWTIELIEKTHPTLNPELATGDLKDFKDAQNQLAWLNQLSVKEASDLFKTIHFHLTQGLFGNQDEVVFPVPAPLHKRQKKADLSQYDANYFEWVEHNITRFNLLLMYQSDIQLLQQEPAALEEDETAQKELTQKSSPQENKTQVTFPTDLSAPHLGATLPSQAALLLFDTVESILSQTQLRYFVIEGTLYKMQLGQNQDADFQSSLNRSLSDYKKLLLDGDYVRALEVIVDLRQDFFQALSSALTLDPKLRAEQSEQDFQQALLSQLTQKEVLKRSLLYKSQNPFYLTFKHKKQANLDSSFRTLTIFHQNFGLAPQPLEKNSVHQGLSRLVVNQSQAEKGLFFRPGAQFKLNFTVLPQFLRNQNQQIQVNQMPAFENWLELLKLTDVAKEWKSLAQEPRSQNSLRQHLWEIYPDFESFTQNSTPLKKTQDFIGKWDKNATAQHYDESYASFMALLGRAARTARPTSFPSGPHSVRQLETLTASLQREIIELLDIDTEDFFGWKEVEINHAEPEDLIALSSSLHNYYTVVKQRRFMGTRVPTPLVENPTMGAGYTARTFNPDATPALSLDRLEEVFPKWYALATDPALNPSFHLQHQDTQTEALYQALQRARIENHNERDVVEFESHLKSRKSDFMSKIKAPRENPTEIEDLSWEVMRNRVKTYSQKGWDEYFNPKQAPLNPQRMKRLTEQARLKQIGLSSTEMLALERKYSGWVDFQRAADELLMRLPHEETSLTSGVGKAITGDFGFEGNDALRWDLNTAQKTLNQMLEAYGKSVGFKGEIPSVSLPTLSVSTPVSTPLTENIHSHRLHLVAQAHYAAKLMFLDSIFKGQDGLYSQKASAALSHIREFYDLEAQSQVHLQGYLEHQNNILSNLSKVCQVGDLKKIHTDEQFQARKDELWEMGLPLYTGMMDTLKKMMPNLDESTRSALENLVAERERDRLSKEKWIGYADTAFLAVIVAYAISRGSPLTAAAMAESAFVSWGLGATNLIFGASMAYHTYNNWHQEFVEAPLQNKQFSQAVDQGVTGLNQWVSDENASQRNTLLENTLANQRSAFQMGMNVFTGFLALGLLRPALFTTLKMLKYPLYETPGYLTRWSIEKITGKPVRDLFKKKLYQSTRQKLATKGTDYLGADLGELKALTTQGEKSTEQAIAESLSESYRNTISRLTGEGSQFLEGRHYISQQQAEALLKYVRARKKTFSSQGQLNPETGEILTTQPASTRTRTLRAMSFPERLKQKVKAWWSGSTEVASVEDTLAAKTLELQKQGITEFRFLSDLERRLVGEKTSQGTLLHSFSEDELSRLFFGGPSAHTALVSPWIVQFGVRNLTPDALFIERLRKASMAYQTSHRALAFERLEIFKQTHKQFLRDIFGDEAAQAKAFYEMFETSKFSEQLTRSEIEKLQSLQVQLRDILSLGGIKRDLATLEVALGRDPQKLVTLLKEQQHVILGADFASHLTRIRSTVERELETRMVQKAVESKVGQLLKEVPNPSLFQASPLSSHHAEVWKLIEQDARQFAEIDMDLVFELWHSHLGFKPLRAMSGQLRTHAPHLFDAHTENAFRLVSEYRNVAELIEGKLAHINPEAVEAAFAPFRKQFLSVPQRIMSQPISLTEAKAMARFEQPFQGTWDLTDFKLLEQKTGEILPQQVDQLLTRFATQSEAKIIENSLENSLAQLIDDVAKLNEIPKDYLYLIDDLFHPETLVRADAINLRSLLRQGRPLQPSTQMMHSLYNSPASKAWHEQFKLLEPLFDSTSVATRYEARRVLGLSTEASPSEIASRIQHLQNQLIMEEARIGGFRQKPLWLETAFKNLKAAKKLLDQ